MTTSQEEITPPDMPPAERPTTVSGMLDELNNTFNDLERYVAGYNTLTRVFQTMTGQLSPGQRPKGLMLTFKGSADDIHSVDVNIDIQKHVDPQQVHYVLVPLASGQAQGMLAAVDQLLAQAAELKKWIEAALRPAPAQQPAAKAA